MSKIGVYRYTNNTMVTIDVGVYKVQATGRERVVLSTKEWIGFEVEDRKLLKTTKTVGASTKPWRSPAFKEYDCAGMLLIRTEMARVLRKPNVHDRRDQQNSTVGDFARRPLCQLGQRS